jgi:hypothetical protein
VFGHGRVFAMLFKNFRRVWSDKVERDSNTRARSSGAVLDRVVAMEMAADGDAQPRTVRRPRSLCYQRIGRW